MTDNIRNIRITFTTGNPTIDNQHDEILQRIKAIITACKERREQSEIHELMTFLRNYTLDHFAFEEQYQMQRGYPGLAAHKKQHDQLVRKLSALEEQYAREGGSMPTVTNSLKLTYEWLSNHINSCDKEMARLVAAGKQSQN